MNSGICSAHGRAVLLHLGHKRGLCCTGNICAAQYSVGASGKGRNDSLTGEFGHQTATLCSTGIGWLALWAEHWAKQPIGHLASGLVSVLTWPTVWQSFWEKHLPHSCPLTWLVTLSTWFISHRPVVSRTLNLCEAYWSHTKQRLIKLFRDSASQYTFYHSILVDHIQYGSMGYYDTHSCPGIQTYKDLYVIKNFINSFFIWPYVVVNKGIMNSCYRVKPEWSAF